MKVFPLQLFPITAEQCWNVCTARGTGNSIPVQGVNAASDSFKSRFLAPGF